MPAHINWALLAELVLLGGLAAGGRPPAPGRGVGAVLPARGRGGRDGGAGVRGQRDGFDGCVDDLSHRTLTGLVSSLVSPSAAPHGLRRFGVLIGLAAGAGLSGLLVATAPDVVPALPLAALVAAPFACWLHCRCGTAGSLGVFGVTPALVAAIAGRLAPVAEEWLGIDPNQVVVSLHRGPGWGSVELTGRGEQRRLRVSLPAGWLARVWAAGLALTGRHLVVAVERAGWPDARVLALRAPGTEPVPLDVHASQPGPVGGGLEVRPTAADAPHWEV